MKSSFGTRSLRAITLGAVLGVAGVSSNLMTPSAAQAVEVQPAPQMANEVMNQVGNSLASQANAQLQAEMETYRRQNIFGITGDLIPMGGVTFERAGICAVEGRKGIVFQFKVSAHMKVDVGTRKLGVKMVRKVFGVTSEQIVQVVALPKQRNDGTFVAEVQPSIISASAVAERHATQGDANNFRDRVSDALRKKLAAVSGDYDLKGAIDRAR